MKSFIILLLAISAGSSVSLLHEFHLSKSTVNYDSESAALQVTMHIFIDDLEDALKQQDLPRLYIGTEKEDSTADLHIANYIKSCFTLTKGSDTLEQLFIGKELSADLAAIWCYIEVPMDSSVGNLDFKNSLLMEVFDDQKNIMTFRKDKKRIDDFLLNKSDHHATIDFR